MRKRCYRAKILVITIVLINLISISVSKAQNVILDPPTIDSISVAVLPNGQYRCVLGWKPYDWTGYNTDSSGFIVRDVHPVGGYTNPDTIYNAFASFYFDSTSNPLEEIQGYGLDAFTYVNGEFIDSEIDNQHSQNIQVKVVNYDSCQTSVSLNWNSYYGEEAPSGTIEPSYDVFAFSSSDVRKVSTSSNSYVFSGLNQNDNYTFWVRAIDPDFTSTSTPAEYYTNKPEIPYSARFNLLETSSDFDNRLSISVDQNLTGKLILYKSTEVDFGFDTLSIYEIPTTEIEEEDVIGSGIITYYYLETQDLCLDTSLLSDTINSIILTAIDRTGYVDIKANNLEFGEATYSIKRLADGEIIYLPVISLPIEEMDTEIFNQALTNPNVTYRVEALTEDSTLIISNPVRVVIKDDIEWPNAIIAGDPYGDGEFRAFPQRSVPELFNLKIFNKWGQLLFETNSIESGWNGTLNGNYVLPGGYLYVATYKFEGGDEKVKKGTVTVIH